MILLLSNVKMYLKICCIFKMAVFKDKYKHLIQLLQFDVTNHGRPNIFDTFNHLNLIIN